MNQKRNVAFLLIVGVLAVVIISSAVVWLGGADNRRESWLRSLPLTELSTRDSQPGADILTHYITADRLMDAGRGAEAWRVAKLTLTGVSSNATDHLSTNIRRIAARLCAEYGDQAQAQQLVDVVAKLYPNDANSLAAEGALAARRHEARDAYSNLSRAATMLPRDADVWEFAGSIAMATKHYLEATNCLRQAVAIAPNDASAHAILSDTLLKSSQIDEAALEMRKAAKLSGSDPAMMNRLSQTLASTARTEPEYLEAADMFRGDLKKHPNNVSDLSILAGLQMRFGHAAEARASEQSYLTHAPNDSAGWLTLESLCGRLADQHGAKVAQARYMHLISLQDATTELIKLVGIHPDDAALFMKLAMVLHSSGRDLDAYHALQQASSLDPQNLQLSEMLHRIEQQMRASDSPGNFGDLKTP